MTTVKSFLKTAVAVAALATLTVSCNKDNPQVAPLELTNNKADASLYVINGQFWSPRNAANWPKIYVNLSGSGAQSTSSTATHQVVFGSHVNGNISAGTGFSIRYVDKDISAVTTADWATATAVTTLGSESGSTVGWYEYNTTTHANDAIAPRTVIVKSNTANVYYAVKLIEFTGVAQTGSGAGLQVKADANISFKTL